MLALAAHDAATNCARDRATAVITLRSGVELIGYLEKPIGSIGEGSTLHIKTKTGWITILFDEVAAIEARKC